MNPIYTQREKERERERGYLIVHTTSGLTLPASAMAATFAPGGRP